MKLINLIPGITRVKYSWAATLPYKGQQILVRRTSLKQLASNHGNHE